MWEYLIITHNLNIITHNLKFATMTLFINKRDLVANS